MQGRGRQAQTHFDSCPVQLTQPDGSGAWYCRHLRHEGAAASALGERLEGDRLQGDAAGQRRQREHQWRKLGLPCAQSPASCHSETCSQLQLRLVDNATLIIGAHALGGVGMP